MTDMTSSSTPMLFLKELKRDLIKSRDSFEEAQDSTFCDSRLQNNLFHNLKHFYLNNDKQACIQYSNLDLTMTLYNLTIIFLDLQLPFSLSSLMIYYTGISFSS